MKIILCIFFFTNIFTYSIDVFLPSWMNWLLKNNQVNVHSKDIILKLESKEHKYLELPISHSIFQKFDLIEEFGTDKSLLNGFGIETPFSYKVIDNLILISRNDQLQCFTAHALEHVDEYNTEVLHQILQGIFYFGLKKSIEGQNKYKSSSTYSVIYSMIDQTTDPFQKLKQSFSIIVIKTISRSCSVHRLIKKTSKLLAEIIPVNEECNENLFNENALSLINKILKFLNDDSCNKTTSPLDQLNSSRELIIKYGLTKLDHINYYNSLDTEPINDSHKRVHNPKFGSPIIRGGFNW